ncbi:hypothetical protein IW261DRAFT_1465843 [Armillaria novae-zelandiae]|uniref:Uncharacterized protein n=1 Tax=Armillaria novae-zelandiae TaxID=153914 RepID=A0AA39PGQ8_9AGAR|nr:hypothetical protein IW261DRAFT_1465843 [Armillaria novae-zelandiae]
MKEAMEVMSMGRAARLALMASAVSASVGVMFVIYKSRVTVSQECLNTMYVEDSTDIILLECALCLFATPFVWGRHYLPLLSIRGPKLTDAAIIRCNDCVDGFC